MISFIICTFLAFPFVSMIARFYFLRTRLDIFALHFVVLATDWFHCARYDTSYAQYGLFLCC